MLAKIVKIFVAPPIAIARVGGSETPLEAYSWVEDPREYGAGQTVVRPSLSFEVLADGSIEPYLPLHLRLKDGQQIRPVCPFFELHATCVQKNGASRTRPLTTRLLERAGGDLNCLVFSVQAANRKAARRTGDRACMFEARIEPFAATCHDRRPLHAWSPEDAGVPLVLRERPVPLGFFQVIRPVNSMRNGVDLSVIRVRFTPGRGEVYGPPEAISGQTQYGKNNPKTTVPHEIVPSKNRILNSQAAWRHYSYSAATDKEKSELEHPSPGFDQYPVVDPPQTYDGVAEAGAGDRSWAVVDDTCDAVITASLELPGQPNLTARARVIVGPPDFAPDRRPIYSLADELMDREWTSSKHQPHLPAVQLHHAAVDLFRRAFETSSLVNVDGYRMDCLQSNKGIRNIVGFPEIGDLSMTPGDEICGNRLLSDRGVEALNNAPDAYRQKIPHLIRSELGAICHQDLAQPEYLIWFLRRYPDKLLEILRPSFACFSQLSETPPQAPNPLSSRDPRVDRELAYDMRMPPYMRDSDFSALSLTRRQRWLLECYLRAIRKCDANLEILPPWSDAHRRAEDLGWRRRS